MIAVAGAVAVTASVALHERPGARGPGRGRRGSVGPAMATPDAGVDAGR